MTTSNTIERLKKLLLDIFFPKFCISCRKEGRYICFDCTLFLSEATSTCPACLKEERSFKTHKRCKGKEDLDGVVALYDYEGLMKKLIYELKHESLVEISQEVVEHGFLMMNNNKNRFFYFLDFLYDKKTVITYVPLEKKKENERGFNQAKEAAKTVARFTGKKTFSCLVKLKENRPQKNLNKKERVENVRDVFLINKALLEVPTKVVIVDDVYTSGATLKECTKVLKSSGVKEVWGFVLARVA